MNEALAIRWHLNIGEKTIASIADAEYADWPWTYGILIDSPEFDRFRTYFSPWDLDDSDDDAYPELDAIFAEIKANGCVALHDLKTGHVYDRPTINHDGETIWFRLHELTIGSPDQPPTYISGSKSIIISRSKSTMPETINFYLVDDDYGVFSNFAPYPIELDGNTWPTTEHYFQAQKFSDTKHADEIRVIDSPMTAARMGRDRSRPLRPDWEDVKDDIMRNALHAKFTQHSTLSEVLLGTGDAMIVEHTKNDSYWGDGGDGTGRNMLGLMLVELRTRIQDGG